MKFERLQGMQDCMKYGEKGNKFYIMLRGVVSVMVPNSQIRSLPIKRKDFNYLLEWKKNHFDPKAKKAQEARIEEY